MSIAILYIVIGDFDPTEKNQKKREKACYLWEMPYPLNDAID